MAKTVGIGYQDFEKVREKIARNDKNSAKFENKINNILKEYNPVNNSL